MAEHLMNSNMMIIIRIFTNILLIARQRELKFMDFLVDPL